MSQFCSELRDQLETYELPNNGIELTNGEPQTMTPFAAHPGRWAAAGARAQGARFLPRRLVHAVTKVCRDGF